MLSLARPGIGCSLKTSTGISGTRQEARTRRVHLIVHASDDEDMVPILSGRRKKGFTSKEYEKLRNPELLGGKTIGEELALIKEQHDAAEKRAAERAEKEFASANWYVGSIVIHDTTQSRVSWEHF